MRIYIIGYMGCGKSTLGKRLAKELEFQFIDMDTYIEERNFKTIPQIFTDYGEEGFRKIEKKALNELSVFSNVVIATGGGAPCFFDNMDVMNETGVTIFLNIDPQILAERLINSKTERPLIKGKSKEELVIFIDETLQKRMVFYKKAQIHITEPDVDTLLLSKEITEIKKDN